MGKINGLLSNDVKYRFSEYRTYKRSKISANGYYQLVSQIRDKTIKRSIISLSPGRDFIYEAWNVRKNNNKQIFFGNNVSEHRIFKSRVLNILHKHQMMGVVLTVLTDDMIKGDSGENLQVKELWGFRLRNELNNSKSFLETFTSEELYDACTKNLHGDTVLPRKEIVYCGTNGKICGWDML